MHIGIPDILIIVSYFIFVLIIGLKFSGRAGFAEDVGQGYGIWI